MVCPACASKDTAVCSYEIRAMGRRADLACVPARVFGSAEDQEDAMTEDMLIEPEEDIESEDIESGIARDIEESLVTLVPLAEILPADFRLSPLVQFVPNIVLREAAENAAEYALSIVVSGADGLKKADMGAAVLRERQQAIESHFLEPTAIAHSLHKRLTTIRSEWLEAGARALKTLGGRMFP